MVVVQDMDDQDFKFNSLDSRELIQQKSKIMISGKEN